VLVVLEQLEFADKAIEGVRGDLRAREQPLFDAQPVKHRALRRPRVAPGVRRGQRGADGLVQLLVRDLARPAPVGARRVFHDGHAMLLEARIPGLDRAPRKGAREALFVGETHLRDVFDARDDALALGRLDGPKDAHFQVGGWIFHAPGTLAGTGNGNAAPKRVAAQT